MYKLKPIDWKKGSYNIRVGVVCGLRLFTAYYDSMLPKGHTGDCYVLRSSLPGIKPIHCASEKACMEKAQEIYDGWFLKFIEE